MNRTELKEWFARARRAHEEEIVGERSPLHESMGMQNPKQTGQFTPEEYLLSAIVVEAWEAGVRWAGGMSIQSDRAAAELEDALSDAGLLIPPATDKTRKDLEMLYKALESNKASGRYDDDFSADLDYGSLEAEEDAIDALSQPDDEDEDTEDDLSFEYKQMVDQGKRDLSKFYDK